MIFLMVFACGFVPALLLSGFMDETREAAKFTFGGLAIMAILVCLLIPVAAGYMLILLGPVAAAGAGVGLGIGHAIKGAIARRDSEL